MSYLRTPIWWFGGKGNMVAKLLKLVPPHRGYVEPFGGGASLLLAKAPARVETYNDLDSALVGFFKVLADPRLFKRFYRRVQATPYSRELYNQYREEWQAEEDPVIRAYKWFVVARMSFGGIFGKRVLLICSPKSTIALCVSKLRMLIGGWCWIGM